MNFRRIIIALASCLLVNILEVGGMEKGCARIPRNIEQEEITSEANMKRCYELIQKEKYTDAIKCFKDAIKTNDSTLCGDVFDIIIMGLTKFGYLTSDIEADNYDIIETSIKKLENISEDKMTSVFSAIYEIAHDKSYSNIRGLMNVFRK